MKQKRLTNVLLEAVKPLMAQAATEAALSQLVTVGYFLPSRKGLEETVEYPEWLQESIDDFVGEAFSQSYWNDISDTTLQDVQQAFSDGLKEGRSIKEISEQIDEILGDEAYYENRAMNIARTETNGILNGARKAAIDGLIEQIPELDLRPTWLAILDTVTRDAHANLDGVPCDENGLWDLGGMLIPYPGYWALPAKDRCYCFPGKTIVSGSFSASQRSWYNGAITKIVTRSGASVTVTPNHPIMTYQGFVPAGSIQPGQQVLSYRLTGTVTPESHTDFSFARYNDIDHKPTSIEQVFQAFFSWAVTSNLPGSIEIRSAQMNDFNGDGQFLDGNIEIIRTNWKLLIDGVSGQFEKIGNEIFPFEVGIATIPILTKSDFTFNAMGDSHSSPSFPSPSETLVSVRVPIFSISPLGCLDLGSASEFDPLRFKTSGNSCSGSTSLFRQTQDVNTRQVPFFDCQSLFTTYPTFFDDVVSVSHGIFSGYVYDLESAYGVIVASDPGCNNGIVTSNCRCSVITEYGMDEAESQQLIQDYHERVKSYRDKMAPNQPRDSHGRFSTTGGLPYLSTEHIRESSRKRSITDAVEAGLVLVKSRPPLNELEERGLITYTHNETGVFQDVNKRLRNGEPLSNMPEDIQALNNKAHTRLPEPPPTIVYRGLSANTYKGVFGEGGAKIGDEVECNSLVSTSLAPEMAVGYAKGNKVIMEIKAKKGLPVLDRSVHIEEAEIVQPHGTKYKVVGILKNDLLVPHEELITPASHHDITIIQVEEV